MPELSQSEVEERVTSFGLVGEERPLKDAKKSCASTLGSDLIVSMDDRKDLFCIDSGQGARIDLEGGTSYRYKALESI